MTETEPRFYTPEAKKIAERARIEAIEECARVAEKETLNGPPPFDWPLDKIEACEATVRVTARSIAAAIRALKYEHLDATEEAKKAPTAKRR